MNGTRAFESFKRFTALQREFPRCGGTALIVELIHHRYA